MAGIRTTAGGGLAPAGIGIMYRLNSVNAVYPFSLQIHFQNTVGFSMRTAAFRTDTTRGVLVQ